MAFVGQRIDAKTPHQGSFLQGMRGGLVIFLQDSPEINRRYHVSGLHEDNIEMS